MRVPRLPDEELLPARASATAGVKTKAKAAAKTAAATSPTKGRRRGRAAAPAPEGLTERLIAVLRGAGMDGVQMSTFEAETKQPAKTIRKVLETMRQANQVTVTGQRRSTRYHAGG